jgi:hypothetical protein
MYLEIYQRVGFRTVNVMDSTEECWESHVNHLARYSYEELLANKIELQDYYDIAGRILRIIPFIAYYLLVSAIK